MVVDSDFNDILMEKIRKLCQKNDSVDLFKNSIVENNKGTQRYRMFEYKSNKQFFHDKMIRKEKYVML
jgi:hypothetical protein